MSLTPLQTLGMIVAVAAGCMLTRFLPFWLFPEHRKVPPAVTYLGHALPPAMMGLLVVYCLKDINLAVFPHALPQSFAIGAIVALHTWKRNVLLSIAGGTGVYMALLQMLG